MNDYCTLMFQRTKEDKGLNADYAVGSLPLGRDEANFLYPVAIKWQTQSSDNEEERHVLETLFSQAAVTPEILNALAV